MNSEGQIKISVFVILFSDYPPIPPLGYFLENKFSLKDSFMTLFEFEFPAQ